MRVLSHEATKCEAVLDVWNRVLRKEEAMNSMIEPDAAVVQGIELAGDRLTLSLDVYDQLRTAYRANPASFGWSVSFPQVFKGTAREKKLLPLFAISLAGIVEGPYREDGWDLTGQPYQSFAEAVDEIGIWHDEPLSVATEGNEIRQFLAAFYDGLELATLEKYAKVPFPIWRNTTTVIHKPYLFCPEPSAYTRNLRRDYDDLLGKVGPRRLLMRPLVREYLFGVPEDDNGRGIYFGAHPTFAPNVEQSRVISYVPRHTMTALIGLAGSGKSTVCAHLCAGQVVTRALRLAEGGGDHSNLTLIVLPTRQAIESVVDKLREGWSGRPIWLQGGSQDVIKSQTLAQLQEAREWLEKTGYDPEVHTALQAEIVAIAADIRAHEEAYLLLEGHRLADQALAERLGTELQATQKECSELDGHLQKLQAALKMVEAYQDLPVVAYRQLHRTLTGVLTDCPSPRDSVWTRLRRLLTFRSPYCLTATVAKDVRAVATDLLGTGFEVVAPRTPADLRMLFELVDRRLEKAVRCKSLLTEVGRLQPILNAKANRLEVLRGELGQVNQRLAVPLPDYYGEFPESEHHLQVELYRKSLAYLSQEALLRKADVLAALDLYTGLLDRDHEGGSSVYRRFGANIERYLRLLSLVVPVVLTTAASVRNMLPYTDEVVDLLVLDESAMALAHHAFPAIARSRRALIVGDPKQLWPVIKLPKDWLARYREESFGDGKVLGNADALLYDVTETRYVSAFHRAAGAGFTHSSLVGNPLELREHRRCQWPIARLAQRLGAPSMIIGTPERISPLEGQHLIFYDVAGSVLDKVNALEIEAVEWCLANEILPAVLPGVPQNLQGELVGVISPFTKQAAALERRLGAKWGLFARKDAVGTVHSFQGAQRKIVVLSTRVEMSDKGGLRFMNVAPNLLYTMITRACEVLVVVGDLRALEAGGKYTRTLVQHIREYGEIRDFASWRNGYR